MIKTLDASGKTAKFCRKGLDKFWGDRLSFGDLSHENFWKGEPRETHISTTSP